MLRHLRRTSSSRTIASNLSNHHSLNHAATLIRRTRNVLSRSALARDSITTVRRMRITTQHLNGYNANALVNTQGLDTRNGGRDLVTNVAHLNGDLQGHMQISLTNLKRLVTLRRRLMGTLIVSISTVRMRVNTGNSKRQRGARDKILDQQRVTHKVNGGAGKRDRSFLSQASHKRF